MQNELRESLQVLLNEVMGAASSIRGVALHVEAPGRGLSLGVALPDIESGPGNIGLFQRGNSESLPV